MSLTSISAVKTLLGISDSSQDTLLTQLLAGVDATIKQWLRRDIEQATYTEFYSGDGTEVLALNQYPVTSITSVHENASGYFTESEFTADELLTAGEDYALMRLSSTVGSKAGFVRRIGGLWPQPSLRTQQFLSAFPGAAAGNIRVVYVAGYSSVPADLAAAANQLVVRAYNQRTGGGLGIQQQSYEDASESFFNPQDSLSMLGTVESILRPYRRVVV